MHPPRVALLLLAGLAACAVHCRQLQPDAALPEPPRCRRAAAPREGCAQPSPDNLLPHPGDCELFYYCAGAGARPVCRQCPAGLHFSPDLHVCDYPERAGCRARNATDPPSTEAPVTETYFTDFTTA